MASIGLSSSIPGLLPGWHPRPSSGSLPVAATGGPRRPRKGFRESSASRQATPAAGRWVAPVANPMASVARRPNQQQGRAVEMLGRAVEYLVDSYVMNGVREPMRLSGPDIEAAQILMRLNREVFAECAEVVPVGRRLREWASGRLRIA